MTTLRNKDTNALEFHTQVRTRKTPRGDSKLCRRDFPPLFPLWPSTRPRTEEWRPQHSLLPRLVSWDGTQAPSVQLVTALLLHTLLRPLPPSSVSLRIRGLSTAQRGQVGGRGGRLSRGCVGGGCASRGAWAGVGRRHVETRGQRLAAQAPK